jgi:type I restriction enzyme R subunit
MAFRPFQPDENVRIHRGHLPHWRQDGVTYFITARLCDSLPQSKLAQWKRERDRWLRDYQAEDVGGVPEEHRAEYHERFTKPWHDWLDAGFGSCALRYPDVRRVLVDRMTGTGCDLDFWVVMPNHIHALLTPCAGSLAKVMQSWKGGSAFEINQHLGRKGKLWQKEGYDHIVRSEEQFWHYRSYIAGNPIKANLALEEYALGVGGEIWASAAELKAQYWG